MDPTRFLGKRTLLRRATMAAAFFLTTSISLTLQMAAQAPPLRAAAPKAMQAPAKPKLVVLLVVDQMRGDYVDKFLHQWTGGLKRLVEEGAWFRDAAYPYAATETCVGHSTISTGAFPATHGMVANNWWDRGLGKSVTCTSDSKAKNSAYGGAPFKDGDSESDEKEGGNSGVRLTMPSFADELKFQGGARTRVVTFSLKARAAITLAGHQADGVAWLDDTTGAWVTSNAFETLPFLDDYVKKNPVRKDYGKTWNLLLDKKKYLYAEETVGSVPPDGWNHSFPHPLRGKAAGADPDSSFYKQWKTSPFADTYLTQLAELAVDQLSLGKAGGMDFLGIAYSPLDYAGHAFGPRSWEVQDILARLDEDLGELFMHLDKEIGHGNYVVALTADHGVVPIPEDMQKTGADAGLLHLPELRERIEKALEAFKYPKPAIASISGSDIYFAPGVFDKLQNDHAAMQAVLEAALAQPGVAAVYRADELRDRPATPQSSTQSPAHRAFAYSYFPGRSGDLFILPKPYWLLDGTPLGKPRSYGTGHGVPYNYDQHVPVLLMGFGIQPGQYFQSITPADIAPTFAALCGITLASRDGHILAQALKKPAEAHAQSQPARPKSAPASAPNTNP